MARLRATHTLPTVLAGLTLLLGSCGGKSAGADSAEKASATRTPAVARSTRIANPTSTSGTPTVTVDATGKARAVPDQLVARFAVHTSGATAAGVLSDSNLRARAVLDRLEQQGVDAKDVQTTQVNLGPTFDKKGNVTGFAADNSIVITLRRLAVAGHQLDAVVRTPGDAARLESVSLGFNDDDKLRAAARIDGVRRARAQAKQMVGAVGADLGAVRTIVESAAPVGYAATASRALDTASAAVPIAPGMLDVTVNVHVVFTIA